MAGLFGILPTSAVAGQYDPSALSTPDRVAMLGAMLKDIGNGGQSNNVLDVRNMLAGQQMMRAQMGLMNTALGGDGGAQTPPVQGAAAPASGSGAQPGVFAAAPPMSGSQRAMATLAMLKGDFGSANAIMNPRVRQGTDGTLYNERGQVVGRLPNHQVVNGFNVDLGAADAPNFIPTLPNGTMPDGRGGAVNIPGVVGAQAEQAGATAGAQEQAKAGWDLVDVPLSNGSSIKLPRAVAAPMLVQAATGRGLLPAAMATGGPPSSAEPGQFGVTQTPAEAELAKTRAATQGQREQLQPKEAGALQDLDNTSTMTSQIVHQMLGDTYDTKSGRWIEGGATPQVRSGEVGGIGLLMSHVPGTQAYNVDQQLEHLRAMTSMEKLQNLRDNSPTGAGLGRVTQQEINLLAAMNGSTDQGQTLQQFNANMRRQLQQLDLMIQNRHNVYNQTYGNIQQPTPGQTAPKAPAYNAPSREALIAEAKRRGLIH